MDNNIDDTKTYEFFWQTALKDPVRRKGVRNFLIVLITFTLIACMVMSCFIAFPLQLDEADIKLFKCLVSYTGLFIIQTLLLGISLSGFKINTKANSNIMVLIVVLHIASWAFAVLSTIVTSMLVR